MSLDALTAPLLSPETAAEAARIARNAADAGIVTGVYRDALALGISAQEAMTHASIAAVTISIDRGSKFNRTMGALARNTEDLPEALRTLAAQVTEACKAEPSKAEHTCKLVADALWECHQLAESGDAAMLSAMRIDGVLPWHVSVAGDAFKCAQLAIEEVLS